MQNLRSKQVIAGVLITVLTAGVVGVLLVTMTPIGCGPANALGLKNISSRCVKPASALVVRTPSPSPYPSSTFSAPTPLPSPSVAAPYTPPASPPMPPVVGPATAAYPPFYGPSTGSGGSFIPARSINCRLPVYAGPPGSGGFVVFPGGSFIADPNSSVALPSGAATPSPTAGYGMGGPSYPGLTYDRAYSKWLPVAMSSVSPDGSRFAYAMTAGSIYLQNVSDGSRVELGAGQQWTVIGVGADSVYAVNPNGAGLWQLPYSGSPRQIATAGYWRAVAAGAAYGTPTSAVPQGASNGIIRLDLKTGAITDWFSRGNSQATVVGFDVDGHPIVQLYYFNAGPEWWLTTGPGTGTPIGGTGQYGGNRPNFQGAPVGDSQGIWFPGYAPNAGAGFALYVSGSQPGLYWMSNIGGQLAGPCA